MTDVMKEIDGRLAKANQEFEALKTQVVNAEQFVAQGKEKMLKLNGAYVELENIKKHFVAQEKAAGEVNK